ncbi:MAG: radical SAM protein [Myxococcales bacterium]|nr:radical SAM protein [Myxococcales bacterium]
MKLSRPAAAWVRSARTLRIGARVLAARVGRQAVPPSVTFILTHRCNFRCAYCDIPAAAAAELTAAEWCQVLDELAAHGLARASFSGGEALLRDDAIDVIAHAHGLGLQTSLNTNGWFTAPTLDRLARHLDLLVLSVDGPRAVHDDLRRRPGSFDRVVEAIEQARGLGLAVATITVLTPHNLEVVEPVLELAARLGFFAYFQPAHADCFDRAPGLAAGLDARVLRDVATRLRAARRTGLPVGASPGYLDRLERAPHFSRCEDCAAGRWFATVMPDGTCVPCHLTSQQRAWPNGRALGFAHALATLPRPLVGAGCAISPYVESDLLFGLDPRAIASAVLRLRGAPVPMPPHG